MSSDTQRVQVLVVSDCEGAPYVIGVYQTPAQAQAAAQAELGKVHATCHLPDPQPLDWQTFPDGTVSAWGHGGDCYTITDVPFQSQGAAQ